MGIGLCREREKEREGEGELGSERGEGKSWTRTISNKLFFLLLFFHRGRSVEKKNKSKG